MSKSDTFENQLLALIFNGTAIPNIAQNNLTSPATQFFWALHTADPGDTGDQTAAEASYAGYARQPVARSTGGMSAPALGFTHLVANMVWPLATGPVLPSVVTVTHFSIGMNVSGASMI